MNQGSSPSELPSIPDMGPILDSPTYRLAYEDDDFMGRTELRPVRMQLELLKPELLFAEHKIESTVVLFGGTQIVERPEAERRLLAAETSLAAHPNDTKLMRQLERAKRVLGNCGYYDHAREFSRIVSSVCQRGGICDYVVVTGGGPGVMEAGNRGAHDVGCKSIGLNITLPHEQAPNPYITPELCFQFRYFAMRKMHFLMRAKALVVFPGGYGTLDELTDALCLVQVGRMPRLPIVMFGREYWKNVINFEYLADEGVILDRDLELIQWADTPIEAWETIAKFHGHSAKNIDNPRPD